MSTHDLVIRAGTVVDGLGGPGRLADVAVDGGIVTAVGGDVGRGRQEIDAEGAVVAPGFVDIHTHYDGQATWDERLLPSAWHGVTTVVMGNCGVGFAPVVPEHHQRLIDLMEGIEDIPGTALHEGLSWEWASFDDYLDALERRPHDIDFATQVPHAALRVHVMGERAESGRAATPDDIASMAKLARAGVEAGALGFTTSRTLNHRSITGELTPSYDAGTDELAGIAAELGAAGRGVLQLVTDFLDVDTDFNVMLAMMKTSGRPLSVSLAQSPLQPDTYLEVLRRMAEVNAAGLQMRAQVAARAVGLLMGLPCTLNPFMTNMVWQQIAGLPITEQVIAMRDPAFKAKVLAAQTDERNRNLIGGRLIHKYDAMFEMTDAVDYEPAASESIAARSERERRSPEDLVYDLMLADDGQAMLYVTSLNYAKRDLDAVHTMLTDANTIPGLSDGGAHVGTICDVSFPTTLLQHWVRERDRDRLPVEFVVQRQARDTAHAVGLLDRGVLAPGYKADINVIDIDKVRLHKPEMRFDLPGGGRRLLQRADGYKHTIVSGKEVYRDGEPTDNLPGRLVRGGQAAPAA
ncbi:MAG TPA: amidohydrolase family protein [Mycobacteriales bacterium]|nr:amidohydrolase family protein [Mycobacteriales bacterium]